MDDSRTVFCGNVSDKVTEELLYELFVQAAPLERVKIPTDREGRKSNFAFVTFKHEESVEYVQRLLNGIRLYDKSLLIKPRHSNSNRLTEVNDASVHSRIGPAPQHDHFRNRSQENHNSRNRLSERLDSPVYSRQRSAINQNRPQDNHNNRNHFRDQYRDEGGRHFRDNSFNRERAGRRLNYNDRRKADHNRY